MARMFYTLDETKTKTGLNEEQLKQCSREGRLREFRDGPRLMFKGDQVDALADEIRAKILADPLAVMERESDDEPLGPELIKMVTEDPEFPGNSMGPKPTDCDADPRTDTVMERLETPFPPLQAHGPTTEDKFEAMENAFKKMYYSYKGMKIAMVVMLILMGLLAIITMFQTYAIFILR